MISVHAVQEPDATIHTEAETVTQLRVAAHGIRQRLFLHGIKHHPLILAKPVNCPPCEAVVGLSVDGRLKQWPVKLPEGLSEAASRVRTAKAA